MNNHQLLSPPPITLHSLQSIYPAQQFQQDLVASCNTAPVPLLFVQRLQPAELSQQNLEASADSQPVALPPLQRLYPAQLFQLDLVALRNSTNSMAPPYRLNEADPSAARMLRQIEVIPKAWSQTPRNPRLTPSLAYERSYRAVDTSQPEFQNLLPEAKEYIKMLVDKANSLPADSEAKSDNKPKSFDGVVQCSIHHQDPATIEAARGLESLKTPYVASNPVVLPPVDEQESASNDDGGLNMLYRAAAEVEANLVIQPVVEQREAVPGDARSLNSLTRVPEQAEEKDQKNFSLKVIVENTSEEQAVDNLTAAIDNSGRQVAAQRAKKAKRSRPSSPTAIGLSPPAPLPQALDYNILLAGESPSWTSASRYTESSGKLRLLGLEAGNWGPHVDVCTPNREPRPGAAGTSITKKAFSWNWGLYTLLARMPGGKAEMQVLQKLGVEWTEGELKKNGSARHALTHDKAFLLIPGPNGAKGTYWRIANLGEKRPKNKGPQTGVNPSVNWGKKNPKLVQTDTTRISSSTSSPSPKKNSSLPPQKSSSNTTFPASKQTPILSTSSSFTPINRQSSSSSERTLLPSSPTKRKSEKSDVDSENTSKRPCVEKCCH